MGQTLNILMKQAQTLGIKPCYFARMERLTSGQQNNLFTLNIEFIEERERKIDSIVFHNFNFLLIITIISLL